MRLARFLAQSYLRGFTPIAAELDPLVLILTRVGINRYSVESQALIRACRAVVAVDGEMVEPDLWALRADSRGLLHEFSVRRFLGKYPKAELDLLERKLKEYGARHSA
jgi:hypothetical protein